MPNTYTLLLLLLITGEEDVVAVAAAAGGGAWYIEKIVLFLVKFLCMFCVPWENLGYPEGSRLPVVMAVLIKIRISTPRTFSLSSISQIYPNYN